MRCSEFQSIASQYIDDALPDVQYEEALHHLEGCVACRSEVELMRQIEAVAGHNLYTGPGEEYWQQVPVRITKRLKKKQHRSLVSTILAALPQAVASPRWRFGFAVSFAVLIAVLLLGRFGRNEQSQQTGTARMEQPDLTARQSAPAEITPDVDLTQFENSSTTVNVSTTSVVSAQDTTVTEPHEGDRTRQVAEVASLPFNNDFLLTAVQIQPQNLIPSVTIAWPLPDAGGEFFDSQQEQEDRAIYGTLALQQSGLVLSAPLPEESDIGNVELESTFNEAMWIVQQSNSLDEKRNIWLSYVNREQNSTYRSLGIYHLALVLADIAENERNRDDAAAALQFYKEHEIILRQLMGSSRFERKTAVLGKIIKT